MVNNWSDRELTSANEDRFGFQDYANVLAERIYTADTPLSIGIFGHWGSGKTSLMKLIEEALPKLTANSFQVSTIWLNVWQLSNQEELWHAFLQALLTGVRTDMKWNKRLIFNWRLLLDRVDRWELFRQVWANAYRILLSLTPLLIGVLWPADFLEKNNQGFSSTFTSWVGGGASVILSSWLLLKPMIEASKEKVSLDLQKMLKDAPYEVQITALQHLQSQFERMVEIWVGKEGKMAVFIDDLDRCSPQKATEVLDAIKLFGNAKRCVYILGLDQEIVHQAIKMSYKFETDIAATDYLEKIVQIQFFLPPLNKHLIEKFVQVNYPNLCETCPTVPAVFAQGLEPNPRKVKRALNTFRTLLDMADVRVKNWDLDPVTEELIAKMVVIQSRFPALHKYLIKNPKFLQLIEEYALGRGGLVIDESRYDEEVGGILLGDENRPRLIEERNLDALNNMLRTGDQHFISHADQIGMYIYLIATEKSIEQIRPSHTERETLLCNNPEYVESLVESILDRGSDPETQHKITQRYIDQLETVSKSTRLYTTSERASSRLAIDYLTKIEERIRNFTLKNYPALLQNPTYILDVFFIGFGQNPRKIKEALRLYQHLSGQSTNQGEPKSNFKGNKSFDAELIAKTLVLQLQFQPLYLELIRNLDHFITLERWAEQIEPRKAASQVLEISPVIGDFPNSLEQFVPELARPTLSNLLTFGKSRFSELGSEMLSALITSMLRPELTAPKKIQEDTEYATRTLNALFDMNLKPPSIKILDSHYSNAYHDGESYCAPPQIQYLPDVTYFTIASIFISKVTELKGSNQPGAISNSYCDVLAQYIKQKRLEQTAETADWLVAPGAIAWVLGENVQESRNKSALRSLRNPGSAYDDPIMGKDPQPAHMKDFVRTTTDNGGIHINSGIPNKVFYEIAIKISTDKAIKIWLDTLKRLTPKSDFNEMARVTSKVAGTVYGEDSAEKLAVGTAWQIVGITV